MTTFAQIEKFVEKVAQEFLPERILLFGSYASGQPNKDSDVDLFVSMPCLQNFTDQALEIRQRIDCDFPLDLIVRSPEEIRRRLKENDLFLTTILEEGKTLYDRDCPGVDRES